MGVYLRTEKNQRSQFLSFPEGGALYYPSVIHCGRQHYRYDEGTNLKAHGHDVFHILLFYEGRNEFTFDNKTVPSLRGLLTLCSPGNRHNFSPRLPGMSSYGEVTFEYISREKRWNSSFGELFHHLFGVGREIPSLLMLDEEGIGRFLDLQERLRNCLEKESGEERYRSDLLLLDLFRFLDGAMEREAPLQRAGRKEDKAEILKEMMRSRFPGKIDLDEASRELGWTKSYLIKRFRLSCGMTPMEYDRRVRVDAAADLIVSTNRTLEDIALSLGFCDVFHFMRTFKKYKGVSPGKYV